MNKKWLALVLVLVMAVVIWVAGTGPDEPADLTATDDVAGDAGNADPASGAADGTDGTAARPGSADASPFALADDEEVDAGSADADAPESGVSEAAANQPADTPSTFATDEPANTFDADAAGQATGSSSAANGGDADNGSASGRDSEASPAAGPAVEVPDSYPVTEAAKYFVPKEERRPGNLGGPPPLDFPGGPSDPNRSPDADDTGGLAPPPAPGQ